VPAGFTDTVYDRVLAPDLPPVPATGYDAKPGETEPASRLVGPVAAQLPVGIDFLGRPFSEPLLFQVASAYEAATHHRRPPADFGPLKVQP
jgi:amidase